ncbi:TPA: hypothetical protein U2I35_002628 [Providencia stuartii]|nr:hypothetical protein [Providencia stuartii]
MESHIELLKKRVKGHNTLNHLYSDLEQLEFKTQDKIHDPHKIEKNISELRKTMTYILSPYISSKFYFFPNEGPFLLRLSDYEILDCNHFKEINELIKEIEISDIIRVLFEESINFELIKSFYKFIYMKEFNINDIINQEQFSEENENSRYKECLEQFEIDIKQTVNIIKDKFKQIFSDKPTLESRIKIHIV